MKPVDVVVSPLTSRASAKLVASIPSQWIIAQYQQEFGLDVSEYFLGLPEAAIYECAETGYRFFHPASMEGKDSLYRHLGKYPWFYQEDKWEHGIAIDQLRPGQKVLDVGCGTGNFLFAARKVKGADVTGIELNPDSMKAARERGLDVRAELIELHARDRRDYYDAVCAFQVLEHVAAAGAFIAGCLSALKPGGLFIVGVPNNASFLQYANAPLNGPPHHMGLWTRKSLTALTRLFPLDVCCVEVEPLNVVDWYQAVMENRYLPKRWMRSIFHRLGGARLFKRYVTENADSIAGHTIMIVYRKRSEPV